MPKLLVLGLLLFSGTRQVPPLDFAAYGDCRSGHEVHRSICASLVKSGAKAVAVSGDLVDWGDDAEDWKIWRELTKELRGKSAYLAAPGNHDVSRDKSFERELGVPRTKEDNLSGPGSTGHSGSPSVSTPVQPPRECNIMRVPGPSAHFKPRRCRIRE